MRFVHPWLGLLRCLRGVRHALSASMLTVFLMGTLSTEGAGFVSRRFPAEAVEGEIIEVVLQAVRVR